ncbi:hypothetical protein LguiB_018081 [Lonicera macranthoides]
MEEEKIRREASVLGYKEKRQSRLFSKKIIYQVGKFNADERPRLYVENNIVGAPCGVVDQMTSACGEANQLFAMVCQYWRCRLWICESRSLYGSQNNQVCC